MIELEIIFFCFIVPSLSAQGALSHRRGRYGEAMPLMKCRIAGDGWCNFQFSVASHHLCTEEEPPFEGGVDLLPPRKRCGDFNAASCFRCRH